MRVIVYGVGAVGGTTAAALSLSGAEVVGIARGAQLTALKERGLMMHTPDGPRHATFTCVSDPSEIRFRPDDAILLTMKGQDTVAALERLRDAGVTSQPIFCVQNGIANEREALRRFPNVHGVTVMMPVTYVTLGEVVVSTVPRYGMFDIGRYPTGEDQADHDLAALLNAANIAAFVDPNVMQSKHGKLLLNLNNILEAALGRGTDRGDLLERLKAEAMAVYGAAEIVSKDVGADDPRRMDLIKVVDVPGQTRRGGSTTQSLIRGAARLETDFLNGEIALLGRLHSVPTPLNSALQNVAATLARDGAVPGTLTLAELLLQIDGHSV